jgi:hypothetical protein
MSKLALLTAVLTSCAHDREREDVTCGEPGEYLWNIYDIMALEGCTHFRGSIRVGDQVFEDFERLPGLRVIDGTFALFRNEAARTSRGVESLEIIGDSLVLTFHPVLADLDGLRNLRAVGGDVRAFNNDAIHDDEVHELVSRLMIGGEIDIRNNASR